MRAVGIRARRCSPTAARRSRTWQCCATRASCSARVASDAAPWRVLDGIDIAALARPRKMLGYMKPSERLAELLAHTG